MPSDPSPRLWTRRWVLSALGGAAACAGNPASSASMPALRLSTAFGPPIYSPDGAGYFNRLIGEAASRIGYAVEIDAPPAERALVNANAGIVDGDGPRIHDLAEIGSYPNLVRVPLPLIVVDFVAFTRGSAIAGDGWAALTPYNVGIVRGWKVLEQNIVGTRSLFRTKTAELLFGLLQNDRIDVAVIDRLSGIAAARARAIRDLHVSRKPLVRRPMFLHLHNRHAALVEPLAAALSAMRADGTFARIEAETLGAYLADLNDGSGGR